MESWVTEQDKLNHQAVVINNKAAKGGAGSARALSEEALKKRQEREQRRAKMSPDIDPTSPDSTSDQDPSLATDLTVTAQQTASRSAHSFVIPTSATSLKWYQPIGEQCIYTSIESATAAGIWSFPSTSLERARCSVFRDLHEKGYFIGGGIKFGGQYLVYPGRFATLVSRNPASTCPQAILYDTILILSRLCMTTFRRYFVQWKS